MYNISAEGSEQIITYHIAGELFPTPWLFDLSRSTIYFYGAHEDCEVYFIPKDEFLNYLTRNPKVMSELLTYYGRSFAASLIRINALEQTKADKKIQYTLFHLGQRFGVVRGNVITIELQITQNDIGAMTGLTRETVAIELNRLRKAGVINYANKSYTIHLKRLANLLGEESLEDISIA